MRNYFSASTGYNADSYYGVSQTTAANTNGMPYASAYIPPQPFTTMLPLQKGLYAGTIFPELDMPYKGKPNWRR